MKLTKKEKAILAQAENIVRETLTKQYQTQFLSNDVATSFLKPLIGNKEQEHFVVIALSSQNHLIDYKIMSTGTINSASVYPREIAKYLLEVNACNCILSHNHPSGVLKPSHADREITISIKKALNLFDIGLLDHIIVSGIDSYSFAQMGELPC